MELINLNNMLDYFIAGFVNIHIVFGALLLSFYKSFYEDFDYMDKYLRYVFLFIIIFASEFINTYIGARIEIEKWMNLFSAIYFFLVYNSLILLTFILIMNYKETSKDIWKAIKFIYGFFSPLVNGFNKIFFRPKPKYVNNAQTNTQFNTQTQAKPKPQAKPKAKPKPKIPRKPKSNIKKAFLKSFGVYTSTNKKLNINADKTCTGGEATIHDSEDGSYAKIFNNDVDLEYKKTIVEELNKMKLSNSIVTPKELLFDKNKNFIGYTMKKKEGIELGKLFLPRGMQHFPNYTLVDIIDLCITIINTYTEVHKQSIIVGDVNPRNILVYDKNNVSIIDSDSFQIGQPSPAYLEEYRRPRYYKKNILSYMRSKRDDTYSITILVFQLLIYGIHPYGGNDEKSIQEAKYIFNLYYPNKHLVTDKVLVKAYSRLSSNLKKLFYDVFKNDKYVLISTLKKNLQSYKQMVLKVQKNERRYKK